MNKIIRTSVLMGLIFATAVFMSCGDAGNSGSVAGAEQDAGIINGDAGSEATVVHNVWKPINVLNAPAGMSTPTSVWTGAEMLVWENGYGGRYNPVTNSWQTISTNNAPSARTGHVAVWTGAKMIIWGGASGGDLFSPLNTGGIYDPASDSWTPTTTTDAPQARAYAGAVWDNVHNKMIVWGGHYRDYWLTYDDYVYLQTGGLYDPASDSWTNMNSLNAPSGRRGFSVVWTGAEMIVWGGETLYCGNWSCDPMYTFINTGGKYNPGSNSWSAISLANAPTARSYHSAVWTGTQMIVWGGRSATPLGWYQYDWKYYKTGFKYNPSTDTWRSISKTYAPAGRAFHCAVWTGKKMIVWGGQNNNGNLNTGGIYTLKTNEWNATTTKKAPGGRPSPACVWTGTQMLVWGGGGLNTGGRYTP